MSPASTGYSGTPLAKKLGLKTGMRALVVHAPPGYMTESLLPVPEGIRWVEKPEPKLDFIHVFCADHETMEKSFDEARDCLTETGMLWISWYKKGAKMPTDLDGNLVREYGLQHGLVDIKVCAVDALWSGLKFVKRKADRK